MQVFPSKHNWSKKLELVKDQNRLYIQDTETGKRLGRFDSHDARLWLKLHGYDWDEINEIVGR